MLQIKKYNLHAKIPIKANATDAGYDLYTPVGGTIPKRGQKVINIGIGIKMPTLPGWGVVGIVKSRSGLSSIHGIEVGAGVIDVSYQNEICIVLYNNSDTDFHYLSGIRIAQLLIFPILLPEVVEVETFEESKDRGGFGSTGIY